jgi:hypothetical protein
MKYQKKPVVIEARQFTTNNDSGENLDALVAWVKENGQEASHNGTDIVIHTPEGDMTGSVGDYIIKGIKGEFYPCKPDIFAATYSEAQEGDGNSIGEVRVRTKFNPSNDGLVDTIKQKTAELINLCQSVKNEEVSKDYDKAPNEPREANGEVIRWVALAQTAYEEAAMYAVKAATA